MIGNVSQIQSTAGEVRRVHESDLKRFPGSVALQALYRFGYGARSHRIMVSVLRATLKIEGGEFVSYTARRLMLDWHNIEVGAYSYGCFDQNRFVGGAKIGRYVSIARSVRSYRRNHPTDNLSTHPLFYSQRLIETSVDDSVRPLEIGPDVWIGAHAVILPGCQKIGAGAIVGAGSVVTRDIEPFAIVGGNPARRIRMRFPANTVSKITTSRWWDRSAEDLHLRMGELASIISPADLAN